MQYTEIKGLSDKRRLPRLGKIRLGLKALSKNSGKEYPTETPYFVCPPEVMKIYGEKPTELDVLFPVEDTAITIPQAYEWYGTGKGLKCIGNGETSLRMDDKTFEMTERECPCEYLESGTCKQRMHLRVILPKVNVGGVYQIDTSSFNSIIDINSSVDYIRALVGRIALVPLKLKRVKTETHHEGKKQNHYTLKLELEADINFINTLRENTARILMTTNSLPAPVTENPELNDEGTTTITEEEAAKLNKERNPGGKPIVSMPQEKQATEKISEQVITSITKIGKTKDGKTYKLYCSSGAYTTENESIAIAAKSALEAGIKVAITHKDCIIEDLDLIQEDISEDELPTDYGSIAEQAAREAGL